MCVLMLNLSLHEQPYPCPRLWNVRGQLADYLIHHTFIEAPLTPRLPKAHTNETARMVINFPDVPQQLQATSQAHSLCKSMPLPFGS